MAQRAQVLAVADPPERALRTLLGELIAFQSAHHAIGDQLGGLELSATSALRAQLAQAMRQLLTRARRAGVVRRDIHAEVATTLISEAAFAIARTRPSRQLADAYLTVLMDGLRPPIARRPAF